MCMLSSSGFVCCFEIHSSSKLKYHPIYSKCKAGAGCHKFIKAKCHLL